MPIKFANNAFGVLASGISNSDTSVTLQTGQGAKFPSLSTGDYFYATLIDAGNNLEIVKCTARSSDVLTIVRAQEATTARSYISGDRIECRLTADTLRKAVALEVTSPPPTGIEEGNSYFDSEVGDQAIYYQDNDGAQWVGSSRGPTSPALFSGNIDGGTASTTVWSSFGIDAGGA
jgi:hypothetical protein